MGSRRTAVIVTIALVLAGWTAFSHAVTSESIVGAAAVVLSVVGYLVGVVGSRTRPPVLLLVVVGCVAASFIVPRAWPGPTHRAVPLAYDNANGLLLLAAAGGLAIAALQVPRRLRVALLLCAGAAVVGAATMHAQAAAACGVLVLFCVLAPAAGRTGLWLWGSVTVLLAAATATVSLGSGYLTSPRPVTEALTPQRLRLWDDAWQIMLGAPARGEGPGSFATLSPTAASDPDLAWAHSSLFQAGAELGIVGLALLVLLMVGAVVGAGRLALVVAALLIPTFVDYVLDFPWTLLVVSLVVGSAHGWASTSTAPPRVRGARPAQGSRTA